MGVQPSPQAFFWLAGCLSLVESFHTLATHSDVEESVLLPDGIHASPSVWDSSVRPISFRRDQVFLNNRPATLNTYLNNGSPI